jgi:molybdopterin-guanine dinucleotide biosynthesis protein
MDRSSSNPFATRFTRPGALGYLFPDGESADTLVERLQANAWRGAIVGPHGAGKSTLLATLIPAISSSGRTVVHVALHAGETSLPEALSHWRQWNPTTQVVVDGYEQLTWWSRTRLALRLRRTGAGLLVTSHSRTDLPTIFEAAPRMEAAREVVRSLTRGDGIISDDDLARVFRSCDGNIRETLFQLYDVYEARARELAS